MSTAKSHADPDAAAPARGHADLSVVWRVLAAIPDPEIPVVSIVDLGIVRSVAREECGVVVRVTPTYSGCPATDWILAAIRDELAAIGVPDARVFLVGNVMIDALLRNRAAADRSTIVSDLALAAGRYAVLTLHRPSSESRERTLFRLS